MIVLPSHDMPIFDAHGTVLSKAEQMWRYLSAAFAIAAADLERNRSVCTRGYGIFEEAL